MSESQEFCHIHLTSLPVTAPARPRQVLNLSSGPGRSRPRPAPRTFVFQSLQPLGGASSRVGGPEEDEAAQVEEAVPRAPARGWARLRPRPRGGRKGGVASAPAAAAGLAAPAGSADGRARQVAG